MGKNIWYNKNAKQFRILAGNREKLAHFFKEVCENIYFHRYNSEEKETPAAKFLKTEVFIGVEGLKSIPEYKRGDYRLNSYGAIVRNGELVFVIKATCQNQSVPQEFLVTVPQELQNQRLIVTKAVELNPQIYSALPEDWQHDPEILGIIFRKFIQKIIHPDNLVNDVTGLTLRL